MPIEVHVETVVLPGGRIEIVVPMLVAGQRATVVVTVEDQKPIEQAMSLICYQLCPVINSLRM